MFDTTLIYNKNMNTSTTSIYNNRKHNIMHHTQISTSKQLEKDAGE
jgi:hypothetical protein